MNTEEIPVASIITMEHLAQKKEQTTSRLDNVGAMLAQILGAILSGKIKTRTTDSYSKETGT